MGFGAVAGHLILFIALFSAGAIAAGAINNSLSAQVDARSEFSDRVRTQATVGYHLDSENYTSPNDRTYANFTNDGSQEIPIDDLTLLVDGTVLEHDQVATFQVRGHTGSNLWMPGEVLEVMTEGRGDVDITISDPYGVQAHRRN